MNLKESVKNYVTNMIKTDSGIMKVLILDDETLRIVNSVYSMSEIMKFEVYLCEKITSQHESLLYLHCVCFVRPTAQNISLLEKELRNPHYKSYNIHFSHSLAKQQLKLLAEADQFELVDNVQESFADFQPCDSFLFHLHLSNVVINREWESKSLTRTVDGVTALLLALKICPQIRYQNSSEVARRLAEKVRSHMSREATLFVDKHQHRSSSLLLIIDRRLDPVTPLLNKWTYQAMIHELLDVENDCVSLPPAEGESVRGEINLNGDHDEFYRQNVYNNFGEICSNVKCVMEELQTKSKTQSKIDSIEDMKRFIENYPSFRKLSAKVSQHVTIISEISKIITANQLLRVSECEQNVVGCHQPQIIDNHASCLQSIKDLLLDRDQPIKKHDALRLVFLYALRYDRHPRKEIANLMNLLLTKQFAGGDGVTETEIQTIRMVLDYGSIRSGELFREKTNSLGIPSNLFKSIKGVDNIYTQHQPFVHTLIDQISNMKLKDVLFPNVAATGGGGSGNVGYHGNGSGLVSTSSNQQRPSDVIIFVIGGVTYDESLAVHNANQQIPDMNIVIGGTQILNYRSFLAEVGSWVGEPLFIDKF